MRAWILAVLLAAAVPATGISSGAMSFDGVDDEITIPDDSSLSFTDGSDNDKPFTMSAWIYPEGNRFYIMGKDNDAANSEYRFSTSTGSTTLLGVLYDNSASPTKYIGRSGGTITTGQWQHVVLTYSGSETSSGIKIYKDGVQVDTGNLESLPYAGMENLGDSLKIGKWETSNANGSIDEVLIYNKALTAPDIQAMFASGGAWYPTDCLVSRWSFDLLGYSSDQVVPNGATIPDTVGSNDGTTADGADDSMTIQSSPVREKRGRR